MQAPGTRRPTRGFLVILALPALLASCGTTLGTVPFKDEGKGEVKIDAKSGELRFWTEFDATYKGELASSYVIELVQEDAVVARATCDPLLLKMPRHCSEREQAGETRKLHCRMACYAHVPKPGPTVIRARYTINQRPENLRLVQANLIVKQE
jgi:hypothetical protein